MNKNNKRNNKIKSPSLHIAMLDFDNIKNPLLNAGQAKATFELGTRLIKKGHTMTVITSRYPGYKNRHQAGIYYKHIGLGSKNIKLNNLIYILTLPFEVRKINADIIIECFTAPISTLFSPLFTKIPVIALPTSFEAERFSRLYHLPLWRIEKFGCRFYTYFAALTPFLADKMKNYNPSIISRIIPNGVAKEYFTIKNKEPEYILFIGRLDINQKGLDLLLEAYAKIAAEIQYPLIIAGDGPDKEKVKKMIQRYNLSKQVQLVGFANTRKKQTLLAKAAFVTFPSRSEGFSLVSLEAAAAGKRLVAFDIPSLSWTSKEAASKVKPFDINAYAKSLVKEARQARSPLKEKQRKAYAKQYSWEEVANKFEDYFQEIIWKKTNIKTSL